MNHLADGLREADTAVEVPPAGLGLRSDLATGTDRLAAGDVRLLISNAGAGGCAELANVDPSEADRVLTRNALASVQFVRAALPGMPAADDGTTIAVASPPVFSAGQVDRRMPPRTLYAAAKGRHRGFLPGPRPRDHAAPSAPRWFAPEWWPPSSTAVSLTACPSP
ncbi:SDR family NAD(P)-dependent oxidoreductase [Streptomyces spinoverrucosus]|uniref:SDR family NAD(P)-dependent oxidoreductase n=1 Tax=Streptomyces spinoverrucosus TaxID=284043 RepID=UPI00142F06A0|nr:SDR family NAD(P)-dependent oxidoreductase [Streptomyces spinoverrucosus]